MMSIYQKRCGVVYFTVILSMFLIILRLFGIALNPQYSVVTNNTATRNLTLGFERATIFDCNMQPITNSSKKFVGLITDIPKATVTLADYYTTEETSKILNEVKGGGAPLIYTDRDITGNGIICFPYTTHSQSIANHLIGYADQSGHGVSGLEAAFDEILYSENKTTLSFSIDGHGNLIEGDSIRYNYDKTIEKNGIATTIDIDIQIIAEEVSKGLKQGAVVISEVETGEIKAIVSRPNFELDRLGEAIKNPDSPLINRAFSTYNVGSIFKPIIAAAAIEKGITNYLWFCEGHSNIDNQLFYCHKRDGHGWLDLNGAIKRSCNAFFYNLAVDVGATRIYSLAEKAGFNNAVSFGYKITTKKSNIGDLEKLSISKRALANLAIGQGELMISPVGILTLYSAIASDGSYYPLSLIKGEVKNGEISEEYIKSEKIRIMSATTAQKLRKALSCVLDEGGTGTTARPQTISAAGKTSTAQTGIIKDGQSVINSWFCGFFPLETPKYAVAVLSENSSKNCGNIFAEIADRITQMEAM